MASFPLYDTFFYYFTQKSSLFVQLFRKKWEKSGKKVGHPQKSCLTSPLNGPPFHFLLFCDNYFHHNFEDNYVLIEY